MQITVAESIGVEGRGRFYEEAGALRDIVQNHLLQVLSFVAMEPPGVLRRRGGARRARQGARRAAADAHHGRRARPVRRPASASGDPVPGYVEEDGVAPNSVTETFVAARVSLDNWRWADTPFYLRTGKRLPKRVTEVAIQFKRVPHLPFSYAAAEQLEPNVLVLRIQPDEGISLRFGAKVPRDAHADPHRQHGLRLRHRVLVADRRGVRDAAAGRDARRPDELHRGRTP